MTRLPFTEKEINFEKRTVGTSVTYYTNRLGSERSINCAKNDL